VKPLSEMPSMRIGHGYDVHSFGAGDSLVLGGVHIPHDRGLVAHSDGDVLIHAICDALLGALGQGDIGQHFPDTDPANAGIDSRLLLRRVMQLVHQTGWLLGNLDATLVAQAPQMAPHIANMRDNLASDMAATVAQVNVKATTTEKLGFVGRLEGIAAHAVVLLQTAA
jgi:2-C-methyl-D-erythritol 2,4-cyclodiphosphate synthase